MGWCHEFGVEIAPGCDHAMVAHEDRCTCQNCGTTCRGKFDSCDRVWARGPIDTPLRPASPVVEAGDPVPIGAASSAAPLAIPDPDPAPVPSPSGGGVVASGAVQAALDGHLAALDQRLGAVTADVLAKFEAQATSVLSRMPSGDDIKKIAAVLSDQRRRIESLQAENAEFRQALDRYRTAEAVDRGLGAAAGRLRAEVEALEQRLGSLPRRTSS